MSLRHAASRPFSSPSTVRTALLASVSVLSLLVAAVPAAHARGLLQGGSAVSPTGTATTAALASAQQAAASAQRAQQSMTRASQAIQAMQAAQVAARGAAQAAPGTVPNGLVAGGLVPDSGLRGPGTANPVSTWVNANTPTQTSANGQTTVSIQQTAPKAILNWASFNIGKDTTVHFDQSAGNSPDGNGWIALNRVTDPSGVPSRILGQIRAEGAVYLINRNGIIFGGSSQINVGTLLASTLGITDDQYANGLLYQASSDPNNIAAAFIGTLGQTAAVNVQAGASISTTSGGKVLLFGGNVTNAGTISTPQGQTILASGYEVYLEPSTDGLRGIVANVENGLNGTYDTTKNAFTHGAGSGGTSQNDGLISADVGNITLVGQNVTQNGVLMATTTAALDGSIRLWARTDQYQVVTKPNGVTTFNAEYRGMFGGTLTLGEGSLTQVRADLNSSDYLLDATQFKASSIDMAGKTIVLKQNSTVLGEAANVTLHAADMQIVSPLFVNSNGSSQSYTTRPDDGSRVYLDTGSLIDVSGLQNVPLAMEQNSVSAELRSAEFADYPQLRDSALRGQTIYVDRRVSGVRSDGTAWVGTAFGDISAWLSLGHFGAGQLMSAGGSVRIDSLGDAIVRGGSQILAAGGSLSYASGYVKTTRIISNGRLYDIGSATPDMVDARIFDGAFTVDHAHWGVEEIYSSGLYSNKGHYESGYVQGQNGGQILVTAHHAVLDGNSDVSAGVGDPVRGNGAIAAGGKLSFGEVVSGQDDRTMPQIVVGTPTSALGAGFTQNSVLSGDLAATAYIRPDLINDSGAKDVAINSNQTVTLDEDVTISLAPGGSFNVLAASAVINGKIRAPAGDITVIAKVASAVNSKGVAQTIMVGSNAVLDATGLWVNLMDGSDPIYSKAWLNGGDVTLSAQRYYQGGSTNAGVSGGLTVSKGSLIDVSSGGLMLANGKLATASDGTLLGNAGTISLIGNTVDFNTTLPKLAPSVIAGELRGYGLGRGGSLAIAAATVQIGGDPSLTGSELYLDPSFFQSGGFNNFRIIGWNGITVAPGVVVEPKAKSFLVSTGMAARPTGSRLIDFASIGFKIDRLRAPTNLALYAPDYGTSAADTYHVGDRGVAGDVVLGAGSVIRVEPGASVDIKASRELAVYGTIIAPGGSISLANDQEADIAYDGPGVVPNFGTLNHRPNVTLWIDSQARLLAPGLVQTTDNLDGTETSRVFDGGSVSLTGGNVVVQPGSVIDVSGASGPFVPSTVPSTAQLTRGPVASQQIATKAGSITIAAGGYLYFDPTLNVHPGNSTMQGATFAINPITTIFVSLPLAYNLVPAGYPAGPPDPVDESGSRIVLRDGSGQASAVAHIGDAVPTSSRPEFTVFEDSLERAEFDDLIFSTLDGVIVFRTTSTVNLSARRSIQLLSRYIGEDQPASGTAPDVNIAAPYVAFGGSFKGSTGVVTNGDPAKLGTGILNVNADLIDFSGSTTFGVDPSIRAGLATTSPLANTAAQAGFAAINFTSTGDIRFNDNSPVPGSTTIPAALNTAGDVTFTATEFYPLTKTGAGFVINGYVVDTTGTTPAIRNKDSKITFLSNGKSAGVPLSANGSLTVSAPHIVQGGTLRAPAGQITLTNATVTLATNLAAAATTDIKLTAGSLTSVDLDGALIPYGTTRNGTDFVVNGQLQTTPPQKLITLNGSTIDVQAGAQVSASGGGDLATYEWVPGSGGSQDVLAGKNVFAVIPSYRGALPKDSDWAGVLNNSLKVGNSVYLSGIPGLAAGYYTLLPGRYALLPGAFRVTLSSANSDVGADRNYRNVMGGYLTAGYFVDQFTQARTSARWSTFLVESGDVVRSRSQYNENKLSDFVTSVAATDNVVAPRLPDEPGRIQFNATSVLTFEGIARTTPIEGGRGGQIDISSGGPILITGTDSTPVAGALVLRADQLSNLETESLMIGGTRSQTSADGNATVLNGASVTVGATSITLDTKGTALSGTEIILVALNSITAKTGSIVEATGPYRSTASPDLLLDQGTTATPTAAQKANDGAAILEVTNGAKPNFVRGNSKTGTLPAIGNVTIQDGVALNGGNSLLIDGSTVALAFGPTSKLTANAVTLGSNHISIGDLAHAQTAPLPGLQLNLGALAALSLINDLTLRSRETIDLYGDFTLGLGSSGASLVTLDSAGLIGTSNAGKTASVTAGTVNLVNSSGTAGTQPTLGSGALVVRAVNVNMGGNVFVDGVSNTELHATGAISSVSTGLFDVRHGALTLEAGQLTSAASVSRVIQASNGSLKVSRSPAGDVAPTVNAGGARLQLIAQSIDQNGDIELPGGVVVLQSTAGNVTFGGTSVTNAGGFSKNFYDLTRDAPAGRVDVIATGGVTVAAGALIDVSSDGDAGTVTVTAGGQFDLQGTLDGQGGDGFRNGAFSLDAGTVTNFDQLNNVLNAARFDRERDFRVRNGDVAIGNNTTIKAHIFTLSTDNGAITVAGRIDASGTQPGSIRLTASGNVVLGNGASLDASGASVDDAGHGGTVSLETANGYIDVQAGSRIDLGAGGDNGVLNLRMPRTAGGIDANNRLNGILTGAGAVNVEAFKVYSGVTTLASSGSGAGTLTFTTIDADNSAFIGSFGAAINTRLKAELTAANAGFDTSRLHLLAGVEVRSSSDLTVTNADAVNLANYRYNGEAGVLTLRAAGNLNINGNISDGFTTASAATGKLLSANAPNARSWSYRLIAGADTAASDVRQAHQAGDVSVAATTLVRTGTGNIEVDAGRDVKFTAKTSVLYTAGVARDVTGLATPTGAVYGVDGGDITIVAGGNISDGNPTSANAGGTIAAPSDELITAWLYRQGNLDVTGAPVAGRPTSWWINYATFQQGGVGALGGGNIKIKAGDPRTETSGKVNNLSVVLPTTGLVNGGQLEFIAGGGDLSVEATGNINSGLFYVGKGLGDIRTNRSFGSARIVSDTNPSAVLNKTVPIYPVLALGDARMNLVAGGDVAIEAIFNPTVTMQAKGNATGLAGSPFSGFFTYSDKSAVSLTSVGGKAVIYSDVGMLILSVPTASDQSTMAIANATYSGTTPPQTDSTTIQATSLWPYLILPPTLNVTAFNGDVGFDGGVTLYPSATGNLEFLSAGSIRLMTTSVNATTGAPLLASVTGIAISDADPLLLPTPIAADFNLLAARSRLLDDPSTDYTKETDVSRARLHATYLLHKGDLQPALFYAVNGDINFRTSTSATSASAIPIVSAKSVRMLASRDILDLRLLAQNDNNTDMTLVRAGRDIRFPFNTAGGANTTDLIYVAGPGVADFEAGRNLNLGNSVAGIESIGDLRNPALSAAGATIVLAAGMSDVHYTDFASTYLDPAKDGGLYNSQLIDYMNRRHPASPTSSAADAWAEFRKLSTDEQAALIRTVFYDELSASADHAAKTDPRDLANYAQGFAAINTLFPAGAVRSGDIRIGSSRAATLDGGDIQLLAPAGTAYLGINQTGGVALGGVVQGAGLQAQQGGDILSMSYGDVLVAQAAVHTLGGGAIGMWSTTGDIDAGKGAKSRKNVVKPAYRTDMNGRTVFSPGSISTGAGIATLQALAGATPGNVWLATPQGFVDAGDAGIRVSGNLTIAAVQVLNASNIQVLGSSIGLPTIAVPNIAALTAASNTAGSSTKAIQEPVNAAPRDQVSVIIVEVLGYGGAQDGGDTGNPRPHDKDKNPADDQRSQNPLSAVQVVGAGQLSREDMQLLTEEERSKLRSRSSNAP
jgi:filamentous hemagglutinin